MWKIPEYLAAYQYHISRKIGIVTRYSQQPVSNYSSSWFVLQILVVNMKRKRLYFAKWLNRYFEILKQHLAAWWGIKPMKHTHSGSANGAAIFTWHVELARYLWACQAVPWFFWGEARDYFKQLQMPAKSQHNVSLARCTHTHVRPAERSNNTLWSTNVRLVLHDVSVFLYLLM